MNTKWNIKAYVEEYCDIICNESNKHRFCKEEICIFPFLNPIRLVNSKNENDQQLRKESGEKLLDRLEDGALFKKEYVKYLKTEQDCLC